MRVVIFTHSLISDWNHGDAHFLRGISSELLCRGHKVSIFEPADGWSLRNLLAERGPDAVAEFSRAYPLLGSGFYTLETLSLEKEFRDASLVLVQQWNAAALIRRIGEYRASHSEFRLLFHDTHHRSVTDPAAMQAYSLSNYDGVLAFGNSVAEIYRAGGWAKRVWTWHEAADVRVFRPLARSATEGDLVWIGNWGDGERAAELREFLIEPVKALGLRARVYGVRYPRHALDALAHAGIQYGGWLPNYCVPEVFSRFRVTVHVPRRPYSTALPGIPTIRPFEALACGIPLISAPWEDSEGLFQPGADYLEARDGAEMRRHLKAVLNDPLLAERLRSHGLATIHSRHTCSHRVQELLEIYDKLAVDSPVAPLRCCR